MGIHDRDYERSDSGGWNGGGGGGFGEASGFEPRMPTSANGRLLLTLVVVYVAQNLFFPTVTDWLSLPSDWLPDRPWRAYGLVTYALLHSTQNIAHLLFNGIALFFFGRSIEQRLGGREYLTFFFAAAAFGGLAWSVAELANGGPRAATLVGASGGIAGLLLFFALCYPNVQVYLMGVLPVPAWLMAVLFIGQDVFGAMNRSGNVAYWAHLGGALFGYLYFRYGWRLSDLLPDGQGGSASGGFELKKLFKRRPNLKIHRDEEEDAPDPADDRVDEILRKIKTDGQDSLTREERRVLEKASRRYQKRPR